MTELERKLEDSIRWIANRNKQKPAAPKPIIMSYFQLATDAQLRDVHDRLDWMLRGSLRVPFTVVDSEGIF